MLAQLCRLTTLILTWRLPADATLTETIDENVSTEDGHEKSTEAMETVLAVETPAAPTDDKFLLQENLPDCQQLMAMMTTGNYNKEAFLVVKKHLSTAKASLQVASIGKRCSLTLTCKLPSNKKTGQTVLILLHEKQTLTVANCNSKAQCQSGDYY